MARNKPRDFISQMADQRQWASQGSCRTGEDAPLFDTERANKITVIDENARVAMDICADCPVMMRCLEHAIRFDVTHGVWGGMVYEQRLAWAAEHHPEWLTQRAWRDVRRLVLVPAA